MVYKEKSEILPSFDEMMRRSKIAEEEEPDKYFKPKSVTIREDRDTKRY